MKYLFTFLFLLASFSFAEDERDLSYLKVTENPNTLLTSLYVGKSCVTTEKKLKKIVEGVLIRSRIKPVEEYREPVLSVGVSCILMENTKSVYNVEVQFGIYDYEFNTPLWYNWSYGSFGIGPTTQIENRIKAPK